MKGCPSTKGAPVKRVKASSPDPVCPYAAPGLISGMEAEAQKRLADELLPALQEHFEDFSLVGHVDGERFMMTHGETEKDCDAITELLRVVLADSAIPQRVDIEG